MSSQWQEELKSSGFAVIPGVLKNEEVKKLSTAFDRVLSNLSELEKTGQHPFEVRYTQALGKKAVYFTRWASFVDEELNHFRMHPEILKVVTQLLGQNLKQITNQMHLKRPGDGVYFPMHQDAAFRKPDSAYRNLSESFLQTILAVDRATPENGCLYFYPKSHLPPKNLLSYEGEPSQFDSNNKKVLDTLGEPLAVSLEPGDLVVSNAYVVHGSGPNHSSNPRRAYINGFVKASDTDNGIEVLKNGKIQPLDPNGKWNWDQIDSYRNLDRSAH